MRRVIPQKASHEWRGEQRWQPKKPQSLPYLCPWYQSCHCSTQWHEYRFIKLWWAGKYYAWGGHGEGQALRRQALLHHGHLPITHSVFDARIKEIYVIVHLDCGQVYLDGGNMNVQKALNSPGSIGADVGHLNFHKTFSILHGGGGPGVGSIWIRSFWIHSS